MSFLERFRANPEKVRVSVRRLRKRGQWRVCVFSQGVCVARGHGKTPPEVVERALKHAACVPGVDLLMENTYEHPQGRARDPSGADPNGAWLEDEEEEDW